MTEIERYQCFKETKLGEIVSIEFDTYLYSEGFFRAPASTKYHGSYEGGLFDHSCAVMKSLVILTENNHLMWKRAESPYIVGMFHDLCKIDSYRHSVIGETLGGEKIYSDEWEFNPDTLFRGHGDKSLMLLSQYITLTDEEALCIRYHMGAFVERDEWKDYTAAIHKYPNVLWTHQADMLASHVAGV